MKQRFFQALSLLSVVLWPLLICSLFMYGLEVGCMVSIPTAWLRLFLGTAYSLLTLLFLCIWSKQARGRKEEVFGLAVYYSIFFILTLAAVIFLTWRTLNPRPL